MILDAALCLGAERGYVGTTLALIKQRTGLPTSALYWHFQSKDDILSDALTHGFTRWNAPSRGWESRRVPAAVERDGLAGAFLDTLRRATAGMDHDSGFWRMGLMLALESGPAVGQGPRERFMKIRGEARGEIEAWWSAALPGGSQDTASLAQFTLAALDGLYLRHQSEGDADTDLLLARLAEGLAATATRPKATVRPDPVDVAPPPVHRAEPDGPTPTSRERLLSAASEVAADSGYEGATISRICQAAGVPASSLYWHFDGKDDLFASLVEHSQSEWAATQPVFHAPQAGASWAEDLHAVVTAAVASVVDRPAFLRIGLMLLLLRRTEPTPGRDLFVDLRHRRHHQVAAWFLTAGATEQDASVRAELMMAINDGLLISQMIDVPPWQTAPIADMLSGVLSAGL